MAETCNFGCSDGYANNVVSFRMKVLQYLCQILSEGLTVVVAPVTAGVVSREANVDVAETSTPVMAANADRKGGWVKNISDSNIFVSLSATATRLKPTLLEPGNSVVLGIAGSVVYQGPVSAIHAVIGEQKQLEVVEF